MTSFVNRKTCIIIVSRLSFWVCEKFKPDIINHLINELLESNGEFNVLTKREKSFFFLMVYATETYKKEWNVATDYSPIILKKLENTVLKLYKKKKETHI